ncbi:MAG: galactose mutarotase [Cyclobacteriaceae bacterium]
MKNLCFLLVTAIMLFACSGDKKKEVGQEQRSKKASLSIKEADFGTLPSGEKVKLFTLVNTNGIKTTITNYGGIITSLWTPDKNGNFGDIVLGYDNLDDYVKGSPYFGAIVGRYGNRIAKGKFSLDGQEYSLAINNTVNHLHGGKKGFDKVLWEAEILDEDDFVGVKLTRTSPDMEEGYPGNLSCEVTYKLNNKNRLSIDYKATTDKKTIVNLTNHSYFNLTANPGNTTILDHELELVAHGYLPVDSTLIPTGELRQVENTPFDFLISTRIGERIEDDDEQLKVGNGYDHCYIFNEQTNELKYAASVLEPTSGRVMNVYTTEVGVQLYTGNFLNGSLIGKNGAVYKHRSALCLETQHYPDSPNKPEFPTTVLEPGQEYSSSTIFEFIALN